MKPSQIQKLLQLTFFTLFISLSNSSQAQSYSVNVDAVTVGSKVQDITLPNTKGEDVSLYSLAKKSIVLVDFWASWCGPCRRANPGMVKFYNEYKDYKYQDAKEGFKIVSISFDKSKDKWLQAIKSDSLYWSEHLSDLAGWSSEAAKTYEIKYIPQCFLIDADGTVIGVYRKAEDARQDLDKLIKKKSWWQRIFS